MKWSFFCQYHTTLEQLIRISEDGYTVKYGLFKAFFWGWSKFFLEQSRQKCIVLVLEAWFISAAFICIYSIGYTKFMPKHIKFWWITEFKLRVHFYRSPWSWMDFWTSKSKKVEKSIQFTSFTHKSTNRSIITKKFCIEWCIQR